MTENDVQIITRNKRARHDFHIHETLEAGLVLKGSEVKSLREGKASIAEAYAAIHEDEAFLHGAYIKPYEHTGEYDRLDPRRERKLLLHKSEIRDLAKQTQIRGNTIVPLTLYFRNGVAKVEIGVATGKKKQDKREDMRKKEAQREMDRAMKKYS